MKNLQTYVLIIMIFITFHNIVLLNFDANFLSSCTIRSHSKKEVTGTDIW